MKDKSDSVNEPFSESERDRNPDAPIWGVSNAFRRRKLGLDKPVSGGLAEWCDKVKRAKTAVDPIFDEFPELIPPPRRGR
jgi:hypothetical protein